MEPKNDTSWPIQSSRNLRCLRSGVVSMVASPTSRAQTAGARGGAVSGVGVSATTEPSLGGHVDRNRVPLRPIGGALVRVEPPPAIVVRLDANCTGRQAPPA